MPDGAEKFRKQEACENIRKECNREFLNVVQIIGGFYALDTMQEAEPLILNKFKIAKELRDLREEDKTEGKDKSKEIKVKEKELSDAEEKLNALRSKHSSEKAFQEYEDFRDEGVDLAETENKRNAYSEKRYADDFPGSVFLSESENDSRTDHRRRSSGTWIFYKK